MSKILVVDDDPMLLIATARGLRLRKHDVIAVANPAEALALKRPDDIASFDLVLTDWEMPGMLGDEFCRAIKVKFPELPVILTSGNANVLGLDCGADAIRTKPYTSSDLWETIDRLVGKGPRCDHGPRADHDKS